MIKSIRWIDRTAGEMIGGPLMASGADDAQVVLQLGLQPSRKGTQ
jgi:hypothetical protein